MPDRYTFIAEDDTFYVNGTARKITVPASLGLDPEIHAIQWNGTGGTVEYKTIDGQCKSPLIVTDFSPWQSLVDAWGVAANT